MAITVFKDVNYSLGGLLSKVRLGEIALPDMQRPFVWSNARVRDLFDSMYKGFPVGCLLFWSTGAEGRQIGTDDKQSAPSLLIVDGQQRLTSLYAVIKGLPVVGKDYTEQRISIAFRPNDQKFEVTDAAICKDPEFIPDVSEVFAGSFLTFATGFLRRLERHRGEPIAAEEQNRLHEALDRLKDLQNYPFRAIELDSTIDEEHVADVFVRINSEGVRLNHGDFILTLMSVFWEKGRRELEEFSRAAKTPTLSGSSPYNHFIAPLPDQMLRVSVGFAFRRGRLQFVYSILRGKNLGTGKFSADSREEQFSLLQSAQEAALDLTNWHEYLKCLHRAGFRSSRMISSQTALLYVYVLWLIGRLDFNVSLKRLRRVIARWWFMAHTTARYTGSSETQIEADLNKLRDIATGDADAFCNTLDAIVTDTFTRDYWDITLPNGLDRSSAKSPPLSAYWAALNLLDAEMLFSDMKVSAMLDPVVTPVNDMQRHHLFPKAYLKSNGVTKIPQINRIANMAFVDWSDNIAISSKAPREYWSQMTSRLDPDRVKRQAQHHALPIGWEQLEYSDFCDKRRKLIAAVTRDGFRRLLDSHSPVAPGPDLRHLIDSGESDRLEFKQSARWSHGTKMKGKSEQIIAKTVSGFMNAEGGTLLIGVADDGSIVGLRSDYETLSKSNRDGYELFLMQLMKDKVSGPATSLCKIRFKELDGEDVCRVDVSPSANPVFTCPLHSKQHTDFWVRQGNQTDQFHGEDEHKYIKDHWG